MHFTRTARARITMAGGECLTLDELAMVGSIFHIFDLLVANNITSVLQPVPTPSSSVAPRMPARQSSTSASVHTLARSHTSPARAASSRKAGVGDRVMVSKSKQYLVGSEERNCIVEVSGVREVLLRIAFGTPAIEV